MLKHLIFICFSITLFSQIDNPESAKLIHQFELREKVFLTKIDSATTTFDMLLTYSDYETFLDKELNQAYKQLRTKLSKDQKEYLKVAQSNWILFKDADSKFLNETFTSEKFGSFSSVGIIIKRTSIIKERLMQLLYRLIAF